MLSEKPEDGADGAQGIASRWSGSGETVERQAMVDDYVAAHGFAVADDGERDVLTGSSGIDWFFANLEGDGVLDKVTDLDDELLANDLEFILQN